MMGLGEIFGTLGYKGQNPQKHALVILPCPLYIDTKNAEIWASPFFGVAPTPSTPPSILI